MTKSSNYKLFKLAFSNKKVFFTLFFLIIASAFSVASITFLANLLFISLVNKEINDFILYFCLIGLFMIFDIITQILKEYLRNKFFESIKLATRKNINSKLIRTNSEYANNINIGEFINKNINDIELASNYFSSALFVFQFSIMAIFILISVFLISYIVALIIILISLLNLIIPYLLKKYLEKNNDKISSANSKYNSRILKIISMLNFIILSRKISFFKDKLLNENNNIEKSEKIFLTSKENAELVKNSISSFLKISLYISTAILIFYNVPFISLSVFGAIVLGGSANYILELSSYISENFLGMRASKKISLLLNDFLLTELEKNETQYNLKNFEKSITYKNYKSLINEDISKNALSISFLKNNKYMIIGKNGLGKSVLLKTLLKMNSQYEGKISIDNLDIKNIYSANIMSKISYTTNNTFLIPGKSIKENITFEENNENINYKKYNFAIEKAKIDFDEKNIIVAENSTNLSAGQIQRIGIARALYHNRDVMIFDESTSNIDKTLKEIIINNILDLKDKTIIFIDHHYDKNYELKFNKVIKII